jgi:hypothetical protein
VDAFVVRFARSVCEHLARLKSVVYAALERQGAATICEAGDRRAILTGPVKSHLVEELVVVAPGLVLRVVYDEARWNPDIFSHIKTARLTLMEALGALWVAGDGPLPPSGGGAAPANPAPANLSLHVGSRNRRN